MRLLREIRADGGIAIYLAAEKPEGVPEENWYRWRAATMALTLACVSTSPILNASIPGRRLWPRS